MKAHDCWDDPLVPSITSDHLEVMTAETLSAAIVQAEIAYYRAIREEPRNIVLHDRLEADLRALEDEDRSRRLAHLGSSDLFHLAAVLQYGIALDTRRHVRRG